MDELSCSRCKRFVKSEKVFVEADGKTLVCEKCLSNKPKTKDDELALPKHGKMN